MYAGPCRAGVFLLQAGGLGAVFSVAVTAAVTAGGAVSLLPSPIFPGKPAQQVPGVGQTGQGN